MKRIIKIASTFDIVALAPGYPGRIKTESCQPQKHLQDAKVSAGLEAASSNIHAATNTWSRNYHLSSNMHLTRLQDKKKHVFPIVTTWTSTSCGETNIVQSELLSHGKCITVQLAQGTQSDTCTDRTPGPSRPSPRHPREIPQPRLVALHLIS